MGYYINPPGKEAWLVEHGQPVSNPRWPPPTGEMLVCLIDNGRFLAAGIAYDEREFHEFAAPDATPEEIETMRRRVEASGAAFLTFDTGHQRPRAWFWVPEEMILAVCPEVGKRLLR